jgi:hypothetical protein
MTTQESGENPMVDTHPRRVPVSDPVRAALWELLKRSARDYRALLGECNAAWRAWSGLYTELADLRTGLCTVLGYGVLGCHEDSAGYPGDAHVLADLHRLRQAQPENTGPGTAGPGTGTGRSEVEGGVA